MSSHSEIFFDDQVYPTQTTPSPEVMCEATPNNDEVTDLKTLKEKLSAALLNINAKQDFVKQHAKVVEEAVSGWEKAESQALILKQQLDAAKEKNSLLEIQVIHLEEVLKECIRQLRQAKEEQEQNIHEAITNNSYGQEAKRPDPGADAASSVHSDIHGRLEYMEKENSSLKIELQFRLKELEFKTIERDLSAQAAETASKQHLESVKKVAKLEAECRRLKSMARKTLAANDHKSLTASSVYVDSFTDSMADSGERVIMVGSESHKLGDWNMNEGEPSHHELKEFDQFENANTTARNHMVHSTEINLMDDFLEMERLAALDAESVSSFPVVGTASDVEVEAMVQKNSVLEKKLAKIEADTLELEMDLAECRKQHEASQSRIKEVELEVVELQTQLAVANKSNEEAYEELTAFQENTEIAEKKVTVVQAEAELLVSKVCSLEEEIDKERALSAENLAKCEKLEDEILRMKHEAQLQKDTEILHGEGVNSELKQEKELALAASRFSECRKTIESLGLQLKSLATLEDFLLDSENNPMELTCEVTQGTQNDAEKLNLQHNTGDLCVSKRDSEPSVSLKPSKTNEKNLSSFGRFYPRTKYVSGNIKSF